MTAGTARLVRSPDTDPWGNLSREELLMGECADDEVIFYLWRNAHTVVIGRNQNAWSECRLDLLEAEGGRLARRSSGGGAVYHDLGNLNFSFIVPRRFYSMERQLGVVLDALRSLGIDAEFSGRNDLAVGGRKFSGNAWQITRDRGLHHGTLLLSVDMSMMSRYLNVDPEKLKSKGVGSVASRVANLADVRPGLELASLMDALEESFLATYSQSKVRRDEAAPEGEEFERLYAKYSGVEWRYGRASECTVSVSTRFPWGGVDLRFDAPGGVTDGTRVFSDAMDGEMILSLAGALNGLPFSWDQIAKAVRARFPGVPEMEDVAGWLQEAPIGRTKEEGE
ncbi:MAG: lipoate--protein ligase [Synergistaceae bacterium]|nr:lipoate--protein ligase [Synergistota bacterium]NLM70983.1 lipoate--protein ligase [Synergistaceae bacterium]